MSDKLLVVETTVDDLVIAEKIAKQLLEVKLVACAQISSPISSFYVWDSKTCIEKEWRIVCKTTIELKNELEEKIKDIHPYDVAEIVYSVKECSAEYFSWVQSSCKKKVKNV